MATNQCYCEGVCPACFAGEVSGGRCDVCKRQFCNACNGVKVGPPSLNVPVCSCKKE